MEGTHWCIEDFARNIHKSIVESVVGDFPEMNVEYTSVTGAVESY